MFKLNSCAKTTRLLQSQRCQAGRLGITTLEFALAAPVLLLFALACADFGRIAHTYQVVCNAARTAAESGATHKFTSFTRSAWEQAVQEAAMEEMQNIPHFNNGEMSYSLTTTMDADGLAIIDVEIRYPFRTKVSWPGLPHEVMLARVVRFRQFR